MKTRKKRKALVLVYFGRTVLVIFTVLISLVILLYSVMFVLAKGPSPSAKELFVRSVMETSAAKFLANIYFTDEEIDAIMNSGIGDIGDDITDPSLIKLPDQDKTNDPDGDDTVDVGKDNDDPDGETPVNTSDVGAETEIGADTSELIPDETSGDEKKDDGIELVEVIGSTYKGTMMIVKDPSRVSVGTLPTYGEGYSGKTLRTFIKESGAVAGINAGGFWDEGGAGTGSVPDGIVIRDGEIIWGEAETFYKCVIGFDSNHILIVGNMTGAEALSSGITDGISFAGGPVLVSNGVAANSKKKLGGGLNPRTAIGQRSDGAILLLVINGRQADSLGATYNDLVNEMVKFGAVNAANLDGGSSTLMVYNGETLNQSAYFFGERKLPDVFLVGAEK